MTAVTDCVFRYNSFRRRPNWWCFQVPLGEEWEGVQLASEKYLKIFWTDHEWKISECSDQIFIWLVVGKFTTTEYPGSPAVAHWWSPSLQLRTSVSRTSTIFPYLSEMSFVKVSGLWCLWFFCDFWPIFPPWNLGDYWRNCPIGTLVGSWTTIATEHPGKYFQMHLPFTNL